MKKLTIHFPPGSLILAIVSVAYMTAMSFLSGLRPEHWIIIAVINMFFFAGKSTRKFILGFSIFAVFAMLYDVMRAFPNYLFHDVDIAGLFNLEDRLFGFNFQGTHYTPNGFFETHHFALADFLSGLFYLNWMPVPLAFAGYLFFTNKKLFLDFSLTFLFVNLIGFCIYYIHPAAPPWYVSKYGFVFNLHTMGSPAGLARFDELIRMNVFGSIYTKNSNVFAAIPSLHCAYPVIVLFYGIKARSGFWNFFFGLFIAGIWFAAVYSGHHYTIDVILGILCAVTGITFYDLVLKNQPWFIRFINRYAKLIS